MTGLDGAVIAKNKMVSLIDSLNLYPYNDKSIKLSIISNVISFDKHIKNIDLNHFIMENS
jgi:hypothetical protein